MQHPEVIDHYLEEELALQRIVGLFQKELVPLKHMSTDSELSPKNSNQESGV